jgi:hypothetical protein
MMNNNIQTEPNSINIMTEKTQNARLITTSEEAFTWFKPNPSSGTESNTCIDDSTKDKLAKTNKSGAIARSKYMPVDQWGIS